MKTLLTKLCTFLTSLALVFPDTLIAADSTILKKSVTADSLARIDRVHTAPVNIRGTLRTLPAVTASEGEISFDAIQTATVSRPGEILEQIPGLIVTQHSGEGKANQYFLRGFNLDHGTDFSLTLDGVPLNMPTHAHGHGYLDANFLIPELIEKITFRKGPYHAMAGDFSAAGQADVHYFSAMPSSRISMTSGSYDYFRLLNLGRFDLDDDVQGKKTSTAHTLSYAVEAQHYNGPWQLAQGLEKRNLVIKLRGPDTTGLTLTAMAYQSDWRASDQLPSRAVTSGLVDRFGALSSSNGGRAERYSLSANWLQMDKHQHGWQASAYAVRNRLNLFSDFTYFLDDPFLGDQFEQADDRTILGGAVQQAFATHLFKQTLEQRWGMQLRKDDISNVGLYRTHLQQRIRPTREDQVDQTSVGIWWQGLWNLSERLGINLGLRGDAVDFDVQSKLEQNSGERQASLFSPKFGATWQQSDNTTLYFNWGMGFHSNDARGVTIKVDPATGDPALPVSPLVRAEGREVGFRYETGSGTSTRLALFELDLASELLFIGDAGNTEASRPSRRRGIEISQHWRWGEHSYVHVDMAHSQALFTDTDAVGNHIPGAIKDVASVAWVHEGQGAQSWSSALRLRYFGSRYLTEDASVKAPATMSVNARAAYHFSQSLLASIDVINLFDRKNSDIDYFYVSRLAGEPASGIADIHSHPAEPRMIRIGMQITY